MYSFPFWTFILTNFTQSSQEVGVLVCVCFFLFGIFHNWNLSEFKLLWRMMLLNVIDQVHINTIHRLAARPIFTWIELPIRNDNKCCYNFELQYKKKEMIWLCVFNVLKVIAISFVSNLNRFSLYQFSYSYFWFLKTLSKPNVRTHTKYYENEKKTEERKRKQHNPDKQSAKIPHFSMVYVHLCIWNSVLYILHLFVFFFFSFLSFLSFNFIFAYFDSICFLFLETH